MNKINSARLIMIIGLSLFVSLFWFIQGQQVFSHGSEPRIQIGRMSVEVLTERLIRFEGYSKVNNINLQGDVYTIDGIKDGRNVSMKVNSLTGLMSSETLSIYLPFIRR